MCEGEQRTGVGSAMKGGGWRSARAGALAEGAGVAGGENGRRH